MGISNQENWNTLCEFLDCDIPSYPFPLASHLGEIPRPINKSRDRIPIQDQNVDILQHDVHPWIIPYERLSAFGVRSEKRSFGHQVGSFKSLIEDHFTSFDESYWSVMEGSFPSNRAIFEGENIAIMQKKGCSLKLKKKRTVNRGYSSASFVSNNQYRFGRFEVTMKPAKADGVITAFFLHRINPWQEIDMEVLGRDTNKLLTNVYFNPGDTGTNCNYGNRGTPIMIDLNFDAAENYHRYAIEWEPHEMRWLIDGELIHVRSIWEPTPVPNVPMRLYSNIWLPKSTELAGELRASVLPVCSYIKNISISAWTTNIHCGSEP